MVRFHLLPVGKLISHILNALTPRKSFGILLMILDIHGKRTIYHLNKPFGPV